ncbi:MAG: DnaJ domain-containing protein, partial [Chloroflexota bacterium]
MGPAPELYATLGVSPSATQEEIRQAFRQLSRRFHPDVNADAAAAAEFRYLAAAYAALDDPAQREAYDATLGAKGLPFVPSFLTSHKQIRRLQEPQIVDCLFEIRALESVSWVEPPLNVCLAIDRSTSMQGPRLDAVKSAAEQIINSLRPDDTFSVITFSDRAEVVLPARPGANKAASISKVSTIRAQGGTEILQGLLASLTEMQTSLTPNSVNHLILFTDGQSSWPQTDHPQ